MNELFLDTSYVIALSFPADQFHGRAVAWSGNIQGVRTRLITTRAVQLEIGNYLSRPRFRPVAVQVLTEMERDRQITILPWSDDNYAEALDLFSRRPDKGWSLTDCLSFVVMTQRGLTDALTADEHFEQAGFRALLRHDPP